jgi:HK97 family phage prohead protease
MTVLAPEAREYAVTLELREAQAIGKPYRFLEGRAVPYETWGDVGMYLEQHAADSFRKSTAGGSGKKLPLLLFHDNRSFPIGHADSWSHDGGLHGVWRLNESEEAQRAGRAAEDGDLVGMSIGFMPIRSEWDFLDWEDWNPSLGPEHKDKVTRQESRLLEVSLTPTPVFAEAEVGCVRTSYSAETRAAKLGQPVRVVDAWRQTVEELRSRV